MNIDYSDDTPDVTYTYTRAGLINSIADAAGTRNFGYNSTFDLTSELMSGIYNKELTWGYTSGGMKGRALSMSIDGVADEAYAYDTFGRINGVNDISYGYLADSNWLSQINRPNNINTVWSYESNRNLVTQIANGGVSTFGYTNNAIGNRVNMSRTGSAFATPDVLTYGYNDRSEVTSALSNNNTSYNYSYNFDPIGNRLTASLAGTPYSYTSNLLNQYTAVNTDTPTYDFDGNMLSNGNWSYTWNGENRLIKAENGSTKLEFDYDYKGRRIFKKVYDGETLTKHTRFVYNDYKLVEELDALNNNASLRKYTWQPESLGLDVPLSVYDVAANATYYYSTDANKNISDLTDAGGNVVAHYEYCPFGTQIIATGAYAAANPFRFSSEYFDGETGLVYYNYRYYSTDLGRWLGRDPIGEEGGLNIYLTNNNFVNYNDNLGLRIVVAIYRPGIKRQNYVSKSKKPGNLNYLHLESNPSYEAFYDGDDCWCNDGKRGDIVLRQQILKSPFDNGLAWAYWNDDGHSQGGQEICPKTNKTVTRYPTYLSDDKGVPAEGRPNGYFDAPEHSNKIRIIAYCRCPCEDDRSLGSLVFDWNPKLYSKNFLDDPDTVKQKGEPREDKSKPKPIATFHN